MADIKNPPVKEVKRNQYEGLFLLNQQHAAADFPATVEFLKDVFRRADAEIIALRKWDERKLAYEIRGQKRGVYMLAYFRAKGAQIANIERDCNLSEQILRTLIIRADHLGETEFELARKDAELTLTEIKLRQRAAEDAAAAAAAATTPAIEPVPDLDEE